MNTTSRNLAYYEADSPARRDYWRYMAAPRARVARVRGIVRRIAPRSLIDLGCGDGSLLRDLSAALPEVELAGLDLSPSQIERNRQAFPHASWYVGDLAGSVSIGRRFAVVLASEVIEHLDEPEALLRNAAHLAEDGGRLVLTTQSGPVRETERRVGHVRHFTAAALTAILTANGWRPERVWNEGFPFHDLSKWWANRNPDASMARFGGTRGYGRSERAVCLALRGAFLLNSRSRGAQLYAVAVRTG